jgi:hypothetical protein
MRVVCSGHLIRNPLGGHALHHLQYLVGFARLGHEVYFAEEAGWRGSCYDPLRDEMSDDPSYGIEFVRELLAPHGLERRWCYVDAEGKAYGASRPDLAQWCREADVYLSLSNMNLLPEARLARRRVLVDTDPVFTQLQAHGLEDPAAYDARLTYGERIGRPGCVVPGDGLSWAPTRQPVVKELWELTPARQDGPLTTVMNWSAYGDYRHNGHVYGQKAREFKRYLDVPGQTGWRLEVALGDAPSAVARELRDHGWEVVDPVPISRDPHTYQAYLRGSAGEFSVAKHAYVSSRCGWFSERACGYLASGRPCVLQDTGFSQHLPTGEGLLAFSTPAEALRRLAELAADYERHSAAARALIEEHFDSDLVLGQLLERSL